MILNCPSVAIGYQALLSRPIDAQAINFKTCVYYSKFDDQWFYFENNKWIKSLISDDEAIEFLVDLEELSLDEDMIRYQENLTKAVIIVKHPIQRIEMNITLQKETG